MSAASDLLTARIAAEHASALPDLPTSVIGRDRRLQAIGAFSARGLPINRQENWRYANLHTLHHARFTPAQPQATLEPSALPGEIEGYARYIFVDGRFAPELSHHSPHPALTIFTTGTEDTAQHIAAEQELADNRLALLNEAFATDGARIVAADTAHPTCIEVVFVATAAAQGGASYPRLQVTTQAGTRLGFIERHISLGSEANFINAVVNIEVGRGATVDHYRLQQTGAEATWMDTLSARVATDGTYRLHLANLGGQSARSTQQISLAGERASTVLNTVSVAGRLQVHDVFAVIEHAAAATQSEQRFRGVAAQQARVGFNGKVVVRTDAHGAVSRQSLRGLLAGPQAEVDVRPQLEIYTDEVQCSHGATAGKLDENMLFYLLSRGMEPEMAQLLLKWAFLEDVVAKIDLPALRGQVEHALAGQMDDTAALRELL